MPIDYRDEENTFTKEDEVKILVPVSGPSGEVNQADLKCEFDLISKFIMNFRGIFTCMLYVMQMVTGKQKGDGLK